MNSSLHAISSFHISFKTNRRTKTLSKFFFLGKENPLNDMIAAAGLHERRVCACTYLPQQLSIITVPNLHACVTESRREKLYLPTQRTNTRGNTILCVALEKGIKKESATNTNIKGFTIMSFTDGLIDLKYGSRPVNEPKMIVVHEPTSSQPRAKSIFFILSRKKISCKYQEKI